jgi:hypothetical protein
MIGRDAKKKRDLIIAKHTQSKSRNFANVVVFVGINTQVLILSMSKKSYSQRREDTNIDAQ